MAMYCLNMLEIALQLASFDTAYEDIASKFFEHFLYISYAINHSDGSGLWDDEDGFYYDRLRLDGTHILLKVRSLVGLIPLLASDTLEARTIDKHPGFKKRMQWFIDHRKDLTEGLASMTERGTNSRRLLSVVNRPRLERMLQRLFDETEFLSPFGIRSLSRYHKEHPYRINLDGSSFEIDYEPAESKTGIFGGNSNWRGPVWFPINYSLIEALQRLDHYYGDTFTVEFPTGSGERDPVARGGLQTFAVPVFDFPPPRAQRLRQKALFRRTPIFASTRCSTNTSTAIPAKASAPATRPAGRAL